MMKQAKCLNCEKIIYFKALDNSSIRCNCGAIINKQAMADMQKLREKRLEMPCDYPPKFHENYFTMWDKSIANEPVGMSYQEGERRIAI